MNARAPLARDAPSHPAGPDRAWFAGVGCSRDCALAELRTLLDAALAAAGITRAHLVGLASIDAKAREPALLALAAELDVALTTAPAGALRAFDDQLSHRCDKAFEHHGCYGVAEGAALARASRVGAGVLALPRRSSQRATVALAHGPAGRT